TGERRIPIADFHTLPGQHPEIENVLGHGGLVTHVELQDRPFSLRSRYVKVRDRASFAFALASCAAALELAGDRIRDARIALGGIATKPWRALEAEHELIGRVATIGEFERAA